MTYPPLLVIVGPTAVGKTAFSLEVALRIGGEIVSADSRLFYIGMDIGTDKPSIEERSKTPHHLIDICLPDETITLGQYKRLATETIRMIHKKNRVPILVGGTGQYVRAITEGWTIPSVSPHAKLRNALLQLGQPELTRWLEVLDPISAAKIDPRNVRRVIRALEITLVKGVPPSILRRKIPPDYAIKNIGLIGDRELLYQRSDARVDEMMRNGLLEEVRILHCRGYDAQLSSMSGLGYRQLLAYIEGEYTLDEAVERIKFETHRFIRQQSNWFRQDDASISWYDVFSPKWQEKAMADLLNWHDSSGYSNQLGA